MKPTMTKVASSMGLNLARSATPPEMMAGMAAAKVSRKKNRVSSKPFFWTKVSAPEKKLMP